jgi:CheY-like chemotaxis protein
MPRVHLICWNAAEAERRTAQLRAAGFEVVRGGRDGAALYRQIKADQPAAVVIDLRHTPAHGRDVALALRTAKATRHIPLVFIEGDAEKTARARALLPDAAFTTWDQIRVALRAAWRNPPAAPVVPESRLAGYAGTPLPKKLGIKAGRQVVLVDAPDGFESLLGALPDDTRLVRDPKAKGDLVIWFTTSRRQLERRVRAVAARAGAGGLWIAWPKKAAGLRSDLTQDLVRQTGLANGLVDYKVCAIDETWSGLRFARRRAKHPPNV